MDSKKIIEKLIKIADSQQKIINKLAQRQPELMAKGQLAPPPQSLPIKTQDIGPLMAQVKALLLPDVAKAVMNLTGGGDSYAVEFTQGHNTQANYDAVLKAIAKLVQAAKLPPPSPGKGISLTAKEHVPPAA